MGNTRAARSGVRWRCAECKAGGVEATRAEAVAELYRHIYLPDGRYRHDVPAAHDVEMRDRRAGERGHQAPQARAVEAQREAYGYDAGPSVPLGGAEWVERTLDALDHATGAPVAAVA